MKHHYSDEEVARVCHEANRALQAVLDDPVPSGPWDAESGHVRDSAIDGVRKARAGTTPRDSHANWVEFKKTAGWVYGPEKDPEARTHPDIMDYDDLPPQERIKDRLFLSIVTALTVG